MKVSCLVLRSGILLFVFALVGQCCGQNYVRIESEAEARARERIEAALSRLGSVDYLDTPLRDVASDLRDRLGVSVVLDKSYLSDAGITADTPVTASMRGVSFRSLLRLMLKDFKATWVIRDEVILITTFEEAEARLETRLYPVLDLVAVGGTTPDKAMRGEHDYDTLINLLTTTVEPDSWDEVGGPGTVAEYPGAGALAISQTAEIHEQVEKVLSAIRRVKDVQGIPALALPTVQGRRIHVARRDSQAPSRRYSSAGAEAWQVPLVHAAE